MNPRIGELIFLEQLAKRYKLPVPEFLSEPVLQSKLKEKLEQWGEGIVKPDVLAGKRGKAGAIRKVEKELDALRALREVAATEVNGLQPRLAYKESLDAPSLVSLCKTLPTRHRTTAQRRASTATRCPT